MGIEKMKKDLIHKVHFNRIKENDRSFSQISFGGTLMFHDPFNLEQMIEVRRDPKLIKKYKEQNDLLLNQYEKMLDKLNQEKLRLQKKIF